MANVKKQKIIQKKFREEFLNLILNFGSQIQRRKLVDDLYYTMIFVSRA